MTRSDSHSTRFILPSAVLVIAIVFLADHYAALGVAVFMIYLVPVALTFFCWRPRIPLIIAGVSTVLILADFMMASSGEALEIARLNCGFGVITMWMVACIGYQFIRIRLAVREENWLQAGQTKLSEQLLGEQRMEELCDNILRF